MKTLEPILKIGQVSSTSEILHDRFCVLLCFFVQTLNPLAVGTDLSLSESPFIWSVAMASALLTLE